VYMYMGCASCWFYQMKCKAGVFLALKSTAPAVGFLMPDKSSAPVLGTVSSDSQSVNTDSICCAKAAKYRRCISEQLRHCLSTCVVFSISCLDTLTEGFRRVRKIASSGYWLRHVCLSVRVEQLGSHWTNFHEICI
jgi:hypothetical protein